MFRVLLVVMLLHLVNGRPMASNGVDYKGVLNNVFKDLVSRLSDSQQSTLQQILSDTSLSKQQLDEKFAAAFDSFGEPIHSEYLAAFANWRNVQAAHMTAMEQLVPSLSADAQAFVNKVIALRKDMSLNPSTEQDQIEAAVDALSSQTREELRSNANKVISEFFVGLDDGTGAGEESPVAAAAVIAVEVAEDPEADALSQQQ